MQYDLSFQTNALIHNCYDHLQKDGIDPNAACCKGSDENLITQ
jgi:hypothetical protein